jgi:hypothetical protein
MHAGRRHIARREPSAGGWARIRGSRVTADPIAAGAGQINIARAAALSSPSTYTSKQSFAAATGLGTLEGARGTAHVVDEVTGTALSGEKDIFGKAWTPTTWAVAAKAGTAWSGGNWNGTVWTGTGFTGTSWASKTWQITPWTTLNWAGRSWADSTWTGRSWAAGTWTGRSWAAGTWTGRSWAAGTWCGRSWAGRTWGDSPTRRIVIPAPTARAGDPPCQRITLARDRFTPAEDDGDAQGHNRQEERHTGKVGGAPGLEGATRPSTIPSMPE